MRENYAALVRRIGTLAQRWVAAHPRAVLRWKVWGPRTAYTGPLCLPEMVELLADSRDARRMLEWIDRRTHRKASLLQACAALELTGIKPEEQRGAVH